jgi:hypothetical protein
MLRLLLRVFIAYIVQWVVRQSIYVTKKNFISDQFARFSGLEKRQPQQEIRSKMEIHLAEQDDADTSLHEIRHEPGTLAYWVYLRCTWTVPQ